MVKRSRDEEGALPAPQRAKPEKPTEHSPPPGWCIWGTAAGGGGVTEKGRTSVEEGKRPVAGASGAAGGSPPRQDGVAGDGVQMQSPAPCDDAALAAPERLPRWWQLWVGRGGGMVVDCEELLWGWFPFVDEDFSCDGGEGGVGLLLWG